MTEQPDESLEPKPASNESSEHQEEAKQDSPAGESLPQPVVDSNTAPTEEDGLPEWEPLTPELVEDEAIRGDFVIRWFVVGLALLIGTSQITESKTLIHIKNGQYLLSHGFLPGSKDVFSQTAGERKWVNLSWLFDIVVSGIYSVGGGVALSIFQGLLVGLVFGLVAHTVRSRIRTWWGSICAVLALLTCYPQFTIQPELVTLLGMSFCLWSLVKFEETSETNRLWALVPALWLWSQFDPRAWFGWALLLLWSGGEYLSREAGNENRKRVWMNVAVASFLVTVVNPFLWETWLAPLRLYLNEYPALQFAYSRPIGNDQAFHPIWAKFIWSQLSHRTIAAMVLAVATLVTMFLNRAQMRYSHMFAFLGFNGLSLLATHEFAAASLVNCAICAVNAQVWYLAKFGQIYSIDWRELSFSRGGRAVTVLSFFTLAWLILSGRLDGPQGKRSGVGFDSYLATAMEEYRSMNSDLIDDHPFNFSVRQGDLMIWGGLKPFVDSRVGIYFGSGDDNLLLVHHRTRQALQKKRETTPGSGDPTTWKAVFDKYQLRQAWPRLNGPIAADYTTFFDLLSSPDFKMGDLNSSTAVFIRTDPTDTAATAFFQEHPFDPIQRTFRTNSDDKGQPREWSKPATSYDNLFSLRRPTISRGIQAAKHYFKLADSSAEMAMPLRMSFALSAIRQANDGLKSDPNSPEAYQVLGSIYAIIGELESAIIAEGKQPTPISLRYRQSITALSQAHALQPDNMDTIRELIQQYQMMGQVDVRLELFHKIRDLQPVSKFMTEDQRQGRQQLIGMIGQLEDQVGRINGNAALQLKNNTADRFQIAVAAYQSGGLLKAIKILEEDAIYFAKTPPQVKMIMANWLSEAGRGREASEMFEILESLGADETLLSWRDPAAIDSMTSANYQRAIMLWNDQIRSATKTHVPNAMMSLPFIALTPAAMAPDEIRVTLSGVVEQTIAAQQLMNGVQQDGSASLFGIALAQMESGATNDAADSIREALSICPNSPLRPLLRFYLECLTGEQIKSKPEDLSAEEYTDLLESDVTSGVKPEAKTENLPDSK